MSEGGPNFIASELIWFNGKLVPWADAKVHVLAHGLQYGTGVFEGIVSYKTAEGPAFFRLDAHIERLLQSAAIYDIEIPYSQQALEAACVDVVRANKLAEVYLRPVAFFDLHTLSVWSHGSPVTVAIAAVDQFPYHEEPAGLRATISPIRKFDNSAMPAWAKACGQYLSAARAVNDARRRGFDEALLLNSQGYVAEGSGENLFIVKRGALITNDRDASILMGVTRASILEIARDLGIETRVAPISVDDLYDADEAFVTGTAVEVRGIREVDGRMIGASGTGPITSRLRETYLQIVHGASPQYRHWLRHF